MSKNYSAPIRGEQAEKAEANQEAFRLVVEERNRLRKQVKMLQLQCNYYADTIRAAGIEPDKVHRPLNTNRGSNE